MVTWVLQTDIFEENLERLQSEITRQGHRFELIKYIPLQEKQDIPEVDGPVIFYGSLNLASKVRKARDWVGVWCDLKKMECTSYYPYYGKFLLNSDYIMLPWGEIDRKRPKIWSKFGQYSHGNRKSGNVFIRPNSGAKPFSGGLLDREESLEHFLANNVAFPEELVIIAREQSPIEEYRLIVCDKEIVGASRYHKNGLLDTEEGAPKEVLAYGRKVVRTWQPEACFVIDITYPGPRLVEINSFSCSGFYEANLSKVVEAASRVALKEWKELYE